MDYAISCCKYSKIHIWISVEASGLHARSRGWDYPHEGNNLACKLPLFFFSVLSVSDVKLYGHWKHVLVLRRYWRPGLSLFGKRTARITDVSQNERIVSVEL